MQSKIVEIRDHATCVFALAVCPGAPSRVNDLTREIERYAWDHSGYGSNEESQSLYVLLIPITPGTSAAKDKPYDTYHGDRTFTVAHQWLCRHFFDIESGDVVDVRYIIGEAPLPVESVRLRYSL